MTKDVVNAILAAVGNDKTKILRVICDGEITLDLHAKNPDSFDFVDVGDSGYVKFRTLGTAVVGNEIPGRPDKINYEHKQFPRVVYVDYEQIMGIHCVDPEGLFNDGDYAADKLSLKNYKPSYRDPLDI